MVKALIYARQSSGDEDVSASKELEDLAQATSKARKDWQKLLDTAGSKKSVANKYTVLSEQLAKFDKNAKGYKELAARVRSFEPKYKEWKKVVEQAAAKEDEYHSLMEKWKDAEKNTKKYNIGKLSPLQYVAVTLDARLKNLKKDRELLEGATAINMSKHRDELVRAFSNRKAQSSIAGMIANAIDEVLQGQLYTDEFSEDEMLQFMEEIFDEVSRDKVDRFNFLRTLAEDKRNYKTVEVKGKNVKVFDMDEITADDMMRVFSGWFRESILMTVLNVLKKIKMKKRLFVPERITRNEDGDEVSLYDSVEPDDSGADALSDGKRRHTGISEENLLDQNAKEIWKDVEAHLSKNLNKITDLINESLQRQLPENAYYRKIGKQKARVELFAVMKKFIHSCRREILNGQFMASTKLRNFVKAAIGGVEDSEIFNIIFTVIRAAFEFYISSYLGAGILESEKQYQRNEDSRDFKVLQNLEMRKDVSRQALHDYRKVHYASRTNKIAQNITADFYKGDVNHLLDEAEKDY